MSFNRFYVISPLALVALSACRSPYGNAVSGVISKGPLSNALVFLDLDGDNVLDSNEQSVRTDADGNFSISSFASSYKIVALTDDSTVDASSGATLSGIMLTAPQGAAVVSPTSTLMAEGGLTADEVAEVLNLPDGVDPLAFNPFADGVDATDALAVEKISQQIMTAVSSFASAAEGAGASETGAFEAALTSVVDVVKVKAENLTDATATAAEKSIDFTATADLDLIKAKVADEAEKVVTAEGTSGFNKAALTALVDDTATSIKNVNDQIEAVADLTSDATKNVFSTLQVLNEQVKTAVQTGGSIAFTDPNTVQTAANNFAPQDINISANSILEGTKDLVIGSLSTIDKDQGSGNAFTYKLAEAAGTDYALFEINSNNELVLKASPDYSEKSSYEVFVVTTDDGGKTFSKKIEVSVTPDPHENFLVKFTVNYVVEGDVGAEYNTLLTSSETNYQEFMSRLHTNMDGLDAALGLIFPDTDTISFEGTEIDLSGLSYAQRFVQLDTAGITLPTISEDFSGGTFSVEYFAPTPVTEGLVLSPGAGETYTMTIKINGLSANSSDFTGTDKNLDNVDYFDPETWTVAGGLQQIVIAKEGTNLLEINITDTTMEIEAEAGFDSNYTNGDVGAILMEGDFSQTNANSFFDILDQLSLDPNSPTPTGGLTENTGGPASNYVSGSGTSPSGSTPNYTIETVKVYGAASGLSGGLTAEPTAIATIGTGSLSLQLGDFTMSIVSDDLPDYITAGDIFDFADVDLLDVEDVIQEGNDGLFTLSHATHGELVIIESDMSNAPAGGTVTMGEGETFGTYEGKRFVSDSNDIVAAYFDFGDLEVSDAQFEAYWETIDGITDMFAEIS